MIALARPFDRSAIHPLSSNQWVIDSGRDSPRLEVVSRVFAERSLDQTVWGIAQYACTWFVACGVSRPWEKMTMSDWQIGGQYFETCNCNLVCPCIVSNLAAQPTDGD